MPQILKKPKKSISRSGRQRRHEQKALRVVNGNTVKITKGWIRELRNSNHFCDAIRTGRALNALSFSLDLLRRNYGSRSSEKRNGHRAVLVAAGYVYETLLLLNSLQGEYEGEPFFEKANRLRADRSKWKTAEKLRNRSGFHLDHDNQVTTKTLDALREKNYELYSAQDLAKGMTVGEYYFNLADEIDVEYFNSEFKDSSQRTNKQTTNKIVMTLGELVKDASFATLELHRGLLVKVGLATSTSEE